MENNLILLKKNSKETTERNYIKNAEKFPLNQNQYGYLPISLQKFLHTDNKKCQINLSNPNLKLNHTCFLRHGVESSKTQSFVACIADIWSGEISDGKNLVSIREMKKKLIEALTIDSFTALQNGNLIEVFAVSSKPAFTKESLSLSDTTNKPIFMQEKAQQEKVAAAYENFKAFLQDDQVEINYIYLWDLICQPNKKLFIKGVNLVI